MTEALTLAAAGLAVGCLLALWLAPRMGPLLHRISPTDPLVYGGVVATLLAVAVLAAVMPARRAVGLDPSEALRSE